jgi:hypothetical protein
MAEIREAFAEPLARRLGRPVEAVREGLKVGDFRVNEDVAITLADGSTLHLRYAFYVEDDEGRAVGVFSEHCGYYFFGSSHLDIEQLRDGVAVTSRIGRDR